ncbi:MAG: lycopene cyclase domain-containing protein [Chitinophagales bacterium]
MKYTYLLIDFFSILVPLLFSFESKMKFYRKWNQLFPALLLTAFVFIVWDYFKTRNGVWTFSEVYTVGIRFFGLPVEEILFFFAIPYSCVFIYESVFYYVKQPVFGNKMVAVSGVVSVLALAGSAFSRGQIYTFSVLFLLAIVLPIAVSLLSSDQYDKFLLTYLISLFPMAVVNGMLTALPVVTYNNAENMGVRVGSIPVEDFVYSFLLLISNVLLYEMFRKWPKTSNALQ